MCILVEVHFTKGTSKIFVSGHVIFDESSFPFQQTTSMSTGSSAASLVLLSSYVMFIPMSRSQVS